MTGMTSLFWGCSINFTTDDDFKLTHLHQTVLTNSRFMRFFRPWFLLWPLRLGPGNLHGLDIGRTLGDAFHIRHHIGQIFNGSAAE